MSTLIIDFDSDCVLFSRVRTAHRVFERLRGLLGVSQLTTEEGLLIDPCNSIHTFGMSMSIDVVFLDRENRITRICSRVLPGRIRFSPGRTSKTLELAAGMAAEKNLSVNQKLKVK